MKKRIAALAAALSITALGGCAANGPGAYEKGTLPPASSDCLPTVSGQIFPARLNEKEEEIAALLAPGTQYPIFDFKTDGTVKTVQINRYRLEEGAWMPQGGSSHTLNGPSGRIALTSDDHTKQIRVVLQSAGGGSTITYDLPENINAQGMASATSYLTSVEDIVYDKEIPLQIQLLTAEDSFSAYGVYAFDTPALYAQHSYEYVYAVTVAFSQQELGDGDGAPKQEAPPPADREVLPAASMPTAPGGVATSSEAVLSTQQDTNERTVFKTLYLSFSPYVKMIPFDIVNDTGKMYGTGDRFRLQILENNVWVDLPQLPLPEDAVILNPAISGPFWPPHTRSRFSTAIDKRDGSNYPLYSLPLKAGTYRLTDEYKIRNVSNPFEITDVPSDWQQSIIERLSKIPEFEGVTFSPRDFTVPFVCQGVISDSDISGVKLYVFLFSDKKEAKAVFDGIERDGYAIPKYSRQNDEITIWETQEFNWEDTPHFHWGNNKEIYLYCGDDEAILSALPDAAAQNYA